MGLSKSIKKFVSNPARVGLAVGTLGGSEVLRSGFNALSPSRSTQDQVPLETPEQRQAREMLLKFVQTGAFGDFKAGADLNLGYGDFGVTDPEKQGLSQLEQLLGSGIPGQFKLGNDALKELMGNGQAGIDAQFEPFKTQVQRQTTDAVDATKRNLGYTGNLYSTSAIRDFGDVQARGNETLTSKLAELTNEAQNRKASLIPTAFNAGQAQESLNLGRIQASQQFGSLTRNLNDASIKARDAEIQRKRQELGLPIQAANSVIGSNVNFGVPSVTTSEPSTLMQLLQIIGPTVGSFMGAKA